MIKINVQDIIDIAKDAGDSILIPSWGKVIKANKADGSAVTEVDQEASLFIIQALKNLTPNIPVISEEATEEENINAMRHSMRWVVDPLDGTVTYLRGPELGGDAGFGVHIALVSDGIPIKGVAYFPAQQRVYFTGDNDRAYMQSGDEIPKLLHVSLSFKNRPIRAAVPWIESKRPLSINSRYKYEAVTAVGGEQLCKVASGKADLVWHDRPDQKGPITQKNVFSHWDLAASHAILKASGGDLFEMNSGKPVTYNNRDFTIPTCVAGHPDLLRQIGFHTQPGKAILRAESPKLPMPR